MKHLFYLILCLFSGLMSGMAQTPNTALTLEQHVQDYDFAVKYIEDNYSGFFQIVTDSRKTDYNEMKDSLRRQVEQSERPCWDAIAAFMGWFNDLHLCLHVSYQDLTYFKYHARANRMIDYRSQMEEYDPKPVASKVTDKTYLIRFPSCDDSPEYRKWIKESIKKFKKSHCENLIIDVRGNRGGNDGLFVPYQQLLYDHEAADTAPVFRFTPQNLAFMKEQGWWQGKRLEQLSVQYPGIEFLPLGINRIKYKECKSLRKAAIIIDNSVASSGESSVLMAKMCSQKTTIYGRDNTVGCLDFANVSFVKLPNCGLTFQMPMSMAYGYPRTAIDPTGIIPDVRIDLPLPKKLTDNIDDWVIWVAKQLEKE